MFKNNAFNVSIVNEYIDSDFAGDKDKRKSLSRYIFNVFGNAIS